ncbi:MAG TPA: ABC transporter substrate-binding protein [Pseudolabrys sp.]|nr:ABC transporter substrate-binding protein [Pseudolabrys sp.]
MTTTQRRRGLGFVAALLGSAVFFGLLIESANADALERIKKAGEVRIANSGVYPPFEFKEGATLVGFDIDLSNLVARELGAKPNISVVDFKGLIPALKSGKVDLLISAVTHTPARAEQVAFSDSYYDTAVAIAVREDKISLKAKDQLAGLTLGAELGTTGEREARSVNGVKEVKTYDTLMLALRDLEIGRIDAIISNLPPLQYLIHKNFKRVRVTGTYDAGWVGINVSQNEKALLAEINRILAKLKGNGELDALKVKWFGEAGK